MSQEILTFDKLDYAASMDDRVVCNGCRHKVDGTEQESIPLAKARAMKAAGKRIGFPGDTIQKQGDWLVVSWSQATCRPGSLQTPPITPMPDGLLHRCPFIKPPGYYECHQPAQGPYKAAEAQAQAAAGDWWD